jgi:hypothetical protein
MKHLSIFLFLFACASENTKFAIPLNQTIDSSVKSSENNYNQTFRPSYNENKASVNLLDDKSFNIDKPEKQDISEIEKTFISKDQKYVYEKDQIEQIKSVKKLEKPLENNQKTIPLVNEKIVEKIKIDQVKKITEKTNDTCYIQFGVFSDKNNAEKLKSKILMKYSYLSLETILKNNQNLLKTKGYKTLKECYSELEKINKNFPDIFVVNSGN